MKVKFILVFLYVSLFFSIMNIKCFLRNSATLNVSSDDSGAIDIQSKSYELYLKAEVLRNSKQVRSAAIVYQKLFYNSPSVYANEGFIKLLYDIGQFNKIADISVKIKNLFKNNLQMQLVFAQSYLYANKDKEADSIFSTLAKDHPDNEHVAYHSAILLLKSGKLKEAIDFLDKCLMNPSLISKHFLFNFLKSKVYLQTKKFDLALKCIEKSLALYPKFDRGWLFKALLSEQIGRVNDAIKGYKEYLGIVGSDSSVEKQLIHLLFMQQRFTEASQVLKSMGVETAAYYFDLALIEWKKKNYSLSLTYIDKSLKKDSSFKKAKFMKIELLFAMHNYNKLSDFVADWIVKAPGDPAIIHTYKLLKRLNVPVSLLIKKLENLVSSDKSENSSENIYVLLLIADLVMEEKIYDKAEKYYKKTLSLASDDKLKSKLLFQLGYIYFVQGKESEMEKTLKKSMEFKEVHPSSYNLLAYHYAVKGKNLDYALGLIKKGLSFSPDCSYYLDTQGIILLKKGFVKKAIHIFEQALNIMPNDKVVQKHLNMARAAIR